MRINLRWNDFESNIKLGFSDLRNSEELFDVTLVCGSRDIQAHKVILSASSSFFRSIFKSVSHQQPRLSIRGVQFHQLESLLCFMYNGEVSVLQEELSGFLAVAEELQVKGLSQEQVFQSLSTQREVLSAQKSADAESRTLPSTGGSSMPTNDLEDMRTNQEYTFSESEDDDLEMKDPTENDPGPNLDISTRNPAVSEDVPTSIHQSKISPINSCKTIRLIRKYSGREVLVDSNRYTYYLNKEDNNNGRKYWSCSRARHSKCTARLHTISVLDQTLILKRIRFHNHDAFDKCLAKRIILRDLKSHSLKNPRMSSDAVVREALSQLDTEAQACVPPFEALDSYVRRWRNLCRLDVKKTI